MGPAKVTSLVESQPTEADDPGRRQGDAQGGGLVPAPENPSHIMPRNMAIKGAHSTSEKEPSGACRGPPCPPAATSRSSSQPQTFRLTAKL